MALSEETYLVRCPLCGSSNRVPGLVAGKSGKCGSCHADLPALYTEPLKLGDASFDNFLRDYAGPILAEFWAPW